MICKGRASISFQDLKTSIRRSVADSSIALNYLGITQVPCLINNPTRTDDKPSLGIYSLDGIHIWYNDFATGDKGDIFNLLSKVWDCSYIEVLSRIQKDLISDDGAEIKKLSHSLINSTTSAKDNSQLNVKVREWRPYDIEYWSSFGISLDWLKFAEVYPISHKIVTKNGQNYTYGVDKLAYVYVEHKDNKVTLKVYQPLNKRGFKWASKHDRSVISLWTKVPQTGDKIVICASLKDALCLWGNTGIPSIALQGEGYSMSNTAIKELKERFKQVYILFDNDKAGIEDSQKLKLSTGFMNLILPQFSGGKDVSDLFKCKGKEAFIKIISNLMNPQESTDDCPF